MKRLIVNADDFGLTAGVNRAIVELHRQLALTSATLMAVAQATRQAADIAHQTPSLGVGCHVVLVDGEPVLPPAQLPTLVDQATGRFRPTLGKFVQDLFLNRIRPSEIEAEASAQIARLRSLGLSLTHVDTHKHTHMFPRVLAPLLRAAGNQGIHAIRNPFEASWSLAATPGAPFLRRTQVHILNRFQPTFRKLVAQAQLATTDGAVGVLATGTLDARTLHSLLQALPNGTWELVTHPGYNDADLANARTRLLSARETEREALQSLSANAELQLIHFGQLHSELNSHLNSSIS
ncbi:ChbG/HpnK family deacetylase [Acidicapsa ligni]|uniref:ChbG/HpnK family deacetylase n=1 Tax=Acidicapsa ligni TaxID=542300 RepID=UPI0021E005FD|nr:ChbG/HpnK family deacetylase [Acidicapsa ligni]